MTDRALRTTLTGEIAAAVEAVPGVAFLRPGLGGLLRSALPRGASAGNGGRTVPAGVRVSRPDDAGPWRVEIHLVARGHVRTLDVVRAVVRATEERLAGLVPGQEPPKVTVTVTGLV
ncbi:hypothetical protein [Streptomyces sp. NBC_00566]|uniref:hypothetical protein n=1 Tax=Streptomyces sp. NBC_00566 TaxID=2975778 RepID=UPI002E819AB3|nr:hypothetical protein [Streptomyces sp. NBC_00566]WUB85222.1 hypothetical protein OG812_00760 [Streptomyces sp. NBC_00566]